MDVGATNGLRISDPGADDLHFRGGDAGWSWSESLALAEPGKRYVIKTIRLSLAQMRCADFGCGEGEVVTCLENGYGGVLLEIPDGRRVRMEREYAWFVKVEAVGEPT